MLVYLVLFFGTIFIGTPIISASIMLNVVDSMFDSNSKQYYFFSKMISPFAIYTFNSVFIPQCVEFAMDSVVFERKSDRLKSMILLYYTFFFINTILLPILEFNSIKQFLFVISQYQFSIEMLEVNIIKESLFFIRYIIIGAFCSLCAVLMDVPHFIYLTLDKLHFKFLNTVSTLKQKLL